MVPENLEDCGQFGKLVEIDFLEFLIFCHHH